MAMWGHTKKLPTVFKASTRWVTCVTYFVRKFCEECVLFYCIYHFRLCVISGYLLGKAGWFLIINYIFRGKEDLLLKLSKSEDVVYFTGSSYSIFCANFQAVRIRYFVVSYNSLWITRTYGRIGPIVQYSRQNR